MAEQAPLLARQPGARTGGSDVLSIGLVNAMSDAALAITEQRFLRLVQSAFPDRPVALRCVTLPQIARGEMAGARITRHYATPDMLVAAPPDAVIFSGAEPTTDDLRQEIFWPGLATLFDWARAEKIPALFSCFAAHAAALHYAGIPRRRQANKVFGMFAQSPAQPHVLLSGVPARFSVAHSRWNAVDAADLEAGGYSVLTHGPQAGVDVFVPKSGLPHVFVQGHPEYESSALEREYRRDMRRFANGETRVAPVPPVQLGRAQTAGSGAASEGSPTLPVHAFADKLIRNWIAGHKEKQA